MTNSTPHWSRSSRSRFRRRPPVEGEVVDLLLRQRRLVERHEAVHPYPSGPGTVRRIAGIVRERLVGARVVAPSSDPLAVATITSYHVVMKSVGVADLKAHLSGHLRTVKRGETLLVLERGTPVARIVPAADLHAGIVTRPPTRDLASAKQMLKRLPPVPLPVDSLSVLLEDRHR